MLKSELLRSVVFHCLKPGVESWAMVSVLPVAGRKGHTRPELQAVAKVSVAHYSVSSSGCKGLLKEKHSQARHVGYIALAVSPPVNRERSIFQGLENHSLSLAGSLF